MTIKKGNRDGFVCVTCIFVGLALLIISFAAYTVQKHNQEKQILSLHHERAYAISHMFMDLKMKKISSWTETAINQYFKELADEKQRCLQEESDFEIPAIASVIEEHVLFGLETIQVANENPLSSLSDEYNNTHGADIEISYFPDENQLMVHVVGYYHNATVRLEGVYGMPKVIVSGTDTNGMPAITVQTGYVKSISRGYH